MLDHHPHRPLADLRCKLVRRLAHTGSTFSGVGASGKPGAVQFFDFYGSGAVLFQNPQVGSTINFLCYTGSALCGGGYNRISISVKNFGGGISQAGVQQIATAAAVPEPAAWAMMIAGVGMAGGALRRRRVVKTTVRFA
jgi:hypothetical protein